jgi:hypothetical protein
MPFRCSRISRGILLVACVSLLCLLSLTRPAHFAVAQEQSERGGERVSESMQDSLAQQFRSAVAGLTNPQLEERKATRRLFQQRAYAEILEKTLASDGLGALIAYLRAQLRLEFFLPRNTLFTYIRINAPARRDNLPGKLFQQETGPYAIPLPEDRSFPADPWSKP